MKKLFSIIAALLLATVVIVFGILLLRPNLVISKAEAKFKYSYPESKFIYWRGAEVHYTDTGTGPPIMMIHGFGGSFTNFEPLAHRLQANHRVICIDLPGFGLSDLPESAKAGGLIGMYRNFSSFMIDHLKLDSVYLIGNSLGGWMSWETTNLRPEKVKKLVLLNSAGYDIEKVRKTLGISSKLNWPIVPLIISHGMPMAISLKNARRIRSDSEPIDTNEVIVSNALANRRGNLHNLIMLATSGEYPDTALIAKIKCPTLIVWGVQDRIIPVEHAQRFKRDIPNSRVLIYDTCGHVPMMEYPDRLAKDIEAFLAAPTQ